MTSKVSLLEARVSAGNFVLGLMVLLLGFEYFTSRYLSRVPDYRLSVLVGGATAAYFLALRFIGYSRRRGMGTLHSAALSAVDLLAGFGVVGLALEYGNYPAAFLLDVSPALYSFAPSGSIPAYAMSSAFAFFMVPRAALHFALPPASKAAAVPQSIAKTVPEELEELIGALEETIRKLRAEAEEENPVVDPRNAKLLVRLVRTAEALHLLWPGLKLEGLRVTAEVPQSVPLPGMIGADRRSRWSNLIVIGLESPVDVKKEELTSVLSANPWAGVLTQRALRTKRQRQSD